MKFKSYEQYIKHCNHYYQNRELSVPIEHLIVSEDSFNIFNGVINFGAGSEGEKENCPDCVCEMDN